MTFQLVKMLKGEFFFKMMCLFQISKMFLIPRVISLEMCTTFFCIFYLTVEVVSIFLIMHEQFRRVLHPVLSEYLELPEANKWWIALESLFSIFLAIAVVGIHVRVPQLMAAFLIFYAVGGFAAAYITIYLCVDYDTNEIMRWSYAHKLFFYNAIFDCYLLLRAHNERLVAAVMMLNKMLSVR